MLPSWCDDLTESGVIHYYSIDGYQHDVCVKLLFIAKKLRINFTLCETYE